MNSEQPTYMFRFEAHDRYGVRRIYDNELKKYVNGKGMTPELIKRWKGERPSIDTVKINQ